MRHKYCSKNRQIQCFIYLECRNKNGNSTALGLIRPDLLLIFEENDPFNFHKFQNCDFASFEPRSYGNHKK